MVATMTLAERFAPSSPPEFAGPGRLRPIRFTWDEVQELVRLGIVPEDASVELLDGLIVPVERGTNGEESSVPGRLHTIVVERMSDFRTRINGPTRHVETQQSLRCSPTFVPLPDFAVIRGRLQDYLSDPPEANDAWCVVEVADTSLRRDAETKRAAYAAGGVRQYVVIDLPKRRALVYERPDVAGRSYPPPTIVEAEGTLRLRIGNDEFFDVALAELLP